MRNRLKYSNSFLSMLRLRLFPMLERLEWLKKRLQEYPSHSSHGLPQTPLSQAIIKDAQRSMIACPDMN